MSVTPMSNLTPWPAVTALDEAADALRQAANNIGWKASDYVDEAGNHRRKAAKDLSKAAHNAARGLEHAAAGTGAMARAGAELTVGAGAAALGAGSWTAEEGARGMAWITHNIVKGLLKLENALSRFCGGDEYGLTKIISDQKAERISKKLFHVASDHVELAGDFAAFGWDEYAKAFDLGVVQSTGNLVAAASNAGMMCTYLGAAAASYGEAAAVKVAEVGVRAARLAMQAAQAGTYVAGEATLLAAKISAALGNLLSHASDPTYQITERSVADFSAEYNHLRVLSKIPERSEP
jgi:hypothetical protein